MPIEVTSGIEGRRYFGECQSCKSKMNWLRPDAKTVVDESGRIPPHSIIDCPVVLPNGEPCATEVYGF